MNILVNARPLVGVLTGIARYVRNLYACLGKEPDVRVGYFTGRDAAGSMPPQRSEASSRLHHQYFRRLPRPVLRSLRIAHWLWYEHRLRQNLSRAGEYAVYHETTFFPPKTKGKIPVVHTLHDLSLLWHAHTQPQDRVDFYNFFIKRRLCEATHVLTVSEYVRNEILDAFHLPGQMVTAIPHASDPCFSPRTPPEIDSVLRRFKLPRPYLLFVGTLEPRKNLTLLIDALPLMRHDIPLVLAGWSGWGDKAWLDTLRRKGLAGRVFLTGHVDDETLACLYGGAEAFVFPSIYEGFGLPILEAMACGCPVVCSNTSSLPEVCGDAALQVAPDDQEELAALLDRILDDSECRADLVRRGFARAQSFRWEESARRTLEVFRKVASQGGCRPPSSTKSFLGTAAGFRL